MRRPPAPETYINFAGIFECDSRVQSDSVARNGAAALFSVLYIVGATSALKRFHHRMNSEMKPY